jgi:protein TonB
VHYQHSQEGYTMFTDTIRAHSTPDPETPPPQPEKDPPPDNTPLPEQAPIEEPTPPKPPIKTL